MSRPLPPEDTPEPECFTGRGSRRSFVAVRKRAGNCLALDLPDYGTRKALSPSLPRRSCPRRSIQGLARAAVDNSVPTSRKQGARGGGWSAESCWPSKGRCPGGSAKRKRGRSSPVRAMHSTKPLGVALHPLELRPCSGCAPSHALRPSRSVSPPPFFRLESAVVCLREKN